MANKEHPRLFFNKETIIDIKKYIDKYESTNFQIWINSLDAIYSQKATSKSRNYLLMDAMNFSFLSYAVSSGLFKNYTFRYSAFQYAYKAFEHFLEIRQRFGQSGFIEEHNNFHFDTDSEGGFINLSIAAVYDWTYSFLSLSQRQKIADAFIWQYENRAKEVNIGVENFLSNKNSAFAHEGAAGGIVLYGDSDLGGSRVKKIQSLVDMLGWLWEERIFKTGDYIFEDHSGWSEGYNYFILGQQQVLWFAAAMSSATGRNYIFETKWLRFVPQYLWSGIIPHKYMGAFSNGWFFERQQSIALRGTNNDLLEQLTSTMYFLKGKDSKTAGFAKWLINKYCSVKDYNDYDKRLWWLMYKFIWGFKDVPSIEPAQSFIPLTDRYGMGDYVIKTSYNDDATRIYFSSERWYINHHVHDDFGHVAVQKYGTLILDVGTAKGGYKLPRLSGALVRQPIFHNILAVYDLNNPNKLYGLNVTMDVRADYYRDPAYQPGGKNEMGRVLAMKSELQEYDFIDYDYTLAYKSDPRILYKDRQLMYIHDPLENNGYSDQEYLLVFDKIELDADHYKLRVLWNTPFQPDAVDIPWNFQGNGFWISNASILRISNTYANAHGRIFLKIIQPKNEYVVRLRGGPGYWFTDAEGNPMSYSNKYNDWAANWVGGWRTEIETNPHPGINTFLTFMQIGDANTLNQITNVTRLYSKGFIGVFINGDRVVFFNEDKSRDKEITYTIKSQKIIKHYLTGLKSGYYFVKQDGKLINSSNTVVDENGVLFFTSNGGGSFFITLEKDANPPIIPKGLRINKN